MNHQEIYNEAFWAVLDPVRFDRNCTPGNKQCGNICIPEENECHETEGSKRHGRRKKIGKALAAAAIAGAAAVGGAMAYKNRGSIAAGAKNINKSVQKKAKELGKEINGRKIGGSLNITQGRNGKPRASIKINAGPQSQVSVSLGRKKSVLENYAQAWKDNPVGTAATHASIATLGIAGYQAGKAAYKSFERDRPIHKKKHYSTRR